jgi:hypothetical protein
MSELGHELKCQLGGMMSALPQGADVSPNPVEVGFGPRLCENEAVAAQWKVGAGAGFYFGVRDLRANQALIASIRDRGPSMAITRFRL